MNEENNNERSIEILPLGSDEKIKLSVKIVQNLIAVKTRSGKIPDADQCMKFLMLCKAKHLNPFEGDCYLLGYDTQTGPQFSQITAHQVFLKRAEASEQFDGMESGVIVKTSDAIEEFQGDFVAEGVELVGGWAKVYRKDRTHPIYRRLKLSTFNTNQSRWAKDPAGMICKCAEADALRTAFPSHLGGLYMKEERDPIDITPAPIPRPTFAPKLTAPSAPPAETPAEEPKPKRKKAEKKEAALEWVRRRLTEDGYTEDDLMTVATTRQWTQELALTDVPERQLNSWLENWEEVKLQISDYRATTRDAETGAAGKETQQDALFQ